MMAKLVFISSDFAGRTYELVVEKTAIGRGDQNTLIIRDRSVSMNHCEILTFGPEVIVRDLDSANGTFVNGARLRGQTQIKSGQVLRFGTVEARLELEPVPDDGGTSELTAVHEHGRLMRAQKKAKSITPLMKLEHAEPSPNEERTILMPMRPAPAPIPAPADVGQTGSPAAKFSRTKVIATTAIMVLGAIILVWLLLLTR
jgi:hypothetical protein